MRFKENASQNDLPPLEKPYTSPDTPFEKNEKFNWGKAEKNLEKVLANIENNHSTYIDRKEENLYYQTMDEISPNYEDAPDSVISLNIKIFNQIIGFEIDEEHPYSYADPRTLNIIGKTIDFKGGKNFGSSLDTLTKIENMHAIHLENVATYGSIYPEFLSLLKEFKNKTLNADANLVLSLYVNRLIETPEYHSGSTGEFRILTEIGNHQFADISLGIWSENISLSEQKNYENIKFLVEKKSEYKKVLGRYAESVENEYLNDRGMATVDIKKYEEGLKNTDLHDTKLNEKELGRIYKYILFALSCVPTIEVDDFDLLASKNSNETAGSAQLFGMLWSNESFRGTVEANIGIKFKDYTPPEQIQILNYLTTLKRADSPKIKEFSETYGQAGFRTFLSLEHGGKELGDKILTLGEKLPKENAELLFQKYGEIINEVDNVASYLSRSIGGKTSPELIEQTKEQLLIKGKDMLAYYADHAKTCAEQECVNLGTELETRLKDLKASVVLLGSAVKTLVERGEFNLQDLKDIEISYDEHGLQEKDKAAISAMSHENTKQYPEKLRDYWRGTAERALEHPAPGETFISVKYQGEIVVVMRVIPQNDGSFYGASFNVNPNIRGSRIGTELMKEVIDNYTKQGDFVADCYEHNPMLENYTGKFGFEIIDTIENYHDTGATIKKIIRRKQAN